MRNIVGDPRVALLFLIPGIAETLRVNGTATISAAPDLLDRFVANGQRPATVIVIRVDAVYFQCSRAVVRADLWNAAGHVERSRLPSVGRILADASAARGNVAPIDGEAYDRDLPGRIATTLY